ncbi:MAG: hypothetical protein H0W86_07515 [Armatimonadetes bacterium]|nr:hypothetical protein [Armatimonadota bacterium]
MQPDKNDPKRFVRTDETPVVDEAAVPEPIDGAEAEENDDSKSPRPTADSGGVWLRKGSPEQTVDVGPAADSRSEGPGGDREEAERRGEGKTDDEEEEG